MLTIRLVLVGDLIFFFFLALHFHSFLDQLRTRKFTLSQTGFCVGICTSTVNTRIRSFPRFKQEFIQTQNDISYPSEGIKRLFTVFFKTVITEEICLSEYQLPLPERLDSSTDSVAFVLIR